MLRPRVARALLAKRSLSTEELDTLTGRSVADVKVNSPELLFLYNAQECLAGLE